jgi:hypothetical protein
MWRFLLMRWMLLRYRQNPFWEFSAVSAVLIRAIAAFLEKRSNQYLGQITD